MGTTDATEQGKLSPITKYLFFESLTIVESEKEDTTCWELFFHFVSNYI